MEDNKKTNKKNPEQNMINFLRNERVIVRYIRKKRGSVEDTRSPLYGGLAETSENTYCVPRQRNGALMNPLTNDEKVFFEKFLGLPEDALSIYKRDNNYWSTGTPDCVNQVTLTKREVILNLNNPVDYFKWKILLLNKDSICPSLQELEDNPRATYRYVLINEAQEAKSVGNKANLKYECFITYGKYKDDASVLRCVIELMDGKKIAPDTKIEHLQSIVTKFIDSDTKRFLEVIKDEYLEYKALIKTCVDKGLIANRNNFYYLRENNMALANEYEEPRLTIAAKYLADPANQDLRDSLIAQTK